MVKLNKTALPTGIDIKRDYRSKKIYDLLIKDCYSKCYICEDDSLPLELEHIIAHGGDDELKYDWNNILAACQHCNNAKNNKKYVRILNCVIDDPEDFLSISIVVGSIFKTHVEITVLRETDESFATKDLLELVYNGENTPRRNVYCPKLRKKVLREHNKLTALLRDYENESNPRTREEYRLSIIAQLDRSSVFAAVKRSTIGKNLKYAKDFGECLL